MFDDFKSHEQTLILLEIRVGTLWESSIPVSLRVDLPFFSVIWQVLEILSHVNKRVKHQHEIGLPLLSLWKLYTDPAASPMVRNFAIVYVEMAFERAPEKVWSSH